MSGDHSREDIIRVKPHIYPTVSEFMETVNIGDFVEYTTKVSKADEDWDANGIDHFASLLGIGVYDQAVEETEDGKYWKVTSYAECVSDGRRSIVAVLQPKKMERYNSVTKKRDLIDDPYALEKAIRRANRNAKRLMFPARGLKIKLDQWMAEEKEKRTAEDLRRIEEQRKRMDAQTAAKSAMKEYRQGYDELNITPTDLLQIAENHFDKEKSEWSISNWKEFASSIAHPDTGIFQNIVSDRSQAASESTENTENPPVEQQLEHSKSDDWTYEENKKDEQA